MWSEGSLFGFTCLSLPSLSPSKTNSFISLLLQGGQGGVISRTSSRDSLILSLPLTTTQGSFSASPGLPPHLPVLLERRVLPTELCAAPARFPLSLASAWELLERVSPGLGSSGLSSPIWSLENSSLLTCLDQTSCVLLSL